MKIDDVAFCSDGINHWIEVHIAGEWIKAQNGVCRRSARVLICRETLYARRYEPNNHGQLPLADEQAEVKTDESTTRQR
jgi:hypothetical protein